MMDPTIVFIVAGFSGSPREDLRDLTERQRVPEGAVETG